MPDLLNQIKPSIPALNAIQSAYDELTFAEQQLIEKRMDEVFGQGMPLELKTDKILYIHLFSLLLQLEVIALQIPLRFGPSMKTHAFREQMRSQLVDEVFHCMLFVKVLNHLCLPYAYFPEPNVEMEMARKFLFTEENPEVALFLLNLIGEAWTELLFSTLVECQVAPSLLQVVIDDEKRHVSEALIYSQSQGINPELLTQRCQQFEPLLLNLFQFHFLVMAEKMIGIDAVHHLVNQFNHRYLESLNSLNIKPSKHWGKAIVFFNRFLNTVENSYKHIKPIPMSPLRQAQMVMWSSPTEACMSGQFAVDITNLDLFSKKFPAETLTSLMIQTASLVSANQAEFRNYLNFNQMYQYQGSSMIGIVVKLPNCEGHLATIVLKDAHLIDISSLSQYIREVMDVMSFCYQECRRMEHDYPDLVYAYQDFLKRLRDPVYPYPLASAHCVSLSNIGMTGIYNCASPLMKNEAVKLTLLRAERKQAWDTKSSSFIIKDMLPVSISADHRVFDGNWPIQALFQESFDAMFAQAQQGQGQHYVKMDILKMIKTMACELEAYPSIQYQCFSVLQTLWPSFMIDKKNKFSVKELVQLI